MKRLLAMAVLALGLCHTTTAYSQVLTPDEKLMLAFNEAKGRLPSASPFKGKKVQATIVHLYDFKPGTMDLVRLNEPKIEAREGQGPIFSLKKQTVNKGPLLGNEVVYQMSGCTDVNSISCVNLFVTPTQSELSVSTFTRGGVLYATYDYRQISTSEVIQVKKDIKGNITEITYYWIKED